MRNKYEALKLNLLKQQQELDMVHQRELQRKRMFLWRITEAGGAPRGRGEDEGAALSPTWELPKAATRAVWAAEGEWGRSCRRTRRKHEDPLEEDTSNMCLKSMEVEILEIQAL